MGNEYIEKHDKSYKINTSKTDKPIMCPENDLIFQKSKDSSCAVVVYPQTSIRVKKTRKIRD